MHIEPGVVDGAKIALSYATAAAAGGYALKHSWDEVHKSGVISLAGRALACTGLTFIFFEVFPNHPVGVSEVHLILGTTLFLLFGLAPAALGLAAGLLVQGVLFAPADLPQYAMNVTTLLVPLFALEVVGRRIIAPHTPYVDLQYTQVLKLSATYQGGVVAWVAFWAFYGQGFGAANIAAVLSFGAAYLLVIVVEPLADLAVLAAAKSWRSLAQSRFVTSRLHHAAS